MKPNFMKIAPGFPQLADTALVPPILNTNPLPEYGYDRLDYGMTIGIERTRGGRIWACWVGGGDDEKAFFVLTTSDDSGRMWSEPRLVIDPHDASLPLARRTLVGNLWLDPVGRLWLFFDQAMTYFDGRAGTWFTRCDHPDEEVPTWTAPERIWHGCSLNKPLVCANGEWLLPVSLWHREKITKPFSSAFHELDAFRMANVLVSRDEGQTWERRGGVAFPNPQFDEFHLIERADGTIWMTARTLSGGLWESVSADGGATWCDPTTPRIANANSRHFLRRLPSGRLLLVKHGQKIDERPFAEGAYSPESRSLLTAFLSSDDGATWEGGLLLDERPGISYPDGAFAPDGTIFISYDHERDVLGEILFARFTEEDVQAGHGVSSEFALRQLISRPLPEKVAERKAREVLSSQALV